MKSVRTVLIEQCLIEPHEVAHNGEFRIECPECHHHNKKLFVSAEGAGVNCKHCSLSMGWKRFLRRFEPPSPEELALDEFIANTHRMLMSSPDLLNYLHERGLTDETIISQNIGYCFPASEWDDPSSVDIRIGLAFNETKWSLENRFTIPYYADGVPTTVRGRIHPEAESDQKYKSLPHSTAQLFIPNGLKIDPSKPVVVVEGEMSSLFLVQEGIQAVGVPGCESWRKEWFNSYKTLYVCMDGDEPGKKATDKYIREIPEVRVAELPEDYGADEYIQKFGTDSFNTLLGKAQLYVRSHKQRNDSLSAIVEDFSNWAWSNGEILGPRILWSPKLEEALSGWGTGLTLMAATSQSGKSRWLTKCIYEMCLENPDDTIGVFLSYDDTLKDTTANLVSLHSQINCNEVKVPRWSFDHPDNPEKKSPAKLKQYLEAVESLKTVNNLILRDASFGRSVNYLRYYFESLRRKYADKKIVVVIDSLAKITAEGSKEVSASGETAGMNFKAFLARELKYFSSMYDLAIITPTDLRKLNDRPRPTVDDLKDASELRYEATNIMLMYNDMSVYRDYSKCYWTPEGSSKRYPILEVILPKNKATGRETTIRYKMIPELCEFEECSEEENFYYERVAREQIEQRMSNKGN